MTDDELLNLLARAAVKNCYGNYALCTCGAVTDIWEKVEPVLQARAERLGLKREPPESP